MFEKLESFLLGRTARPPVCILEPAGCKQPVETVLEFPACHTHRDAFLVHLGGVAVSMMAQKYLLARNPAKTKNGPLKKISGVTKSKNGGHLKTAKRGF